MSPYGDALGISTSLIGLGHLLRDQPLEVPPYQRSYSWQPEQVEAFWFDLLGALESQSPVYFVGTVVLSSAQNGRATVIDGQQRLATTTIFLAAVRDALAALGEQLRADTVEREFIAGTSLETGELEPRLLLNVSDRPFFHTEIITGIDAVHASPSTTSSHERIRNASRILSKFLRDDIAVSGPNAVARLVRWVDLLDNRTQAIVVGVADDADAFLIFETLNDRGLELTVADVIKNYLFGLCREDISQAQEAWSNVTGSIEESVDETQVTTFMRQWWSSQHGLTRERDLYRDIRLLVDDHSGALALLRDMESSAPLFAAILDANNAWWGDLPEAVQFAATTLLNLGLEQYRPLLLAAMRKFSEDELELSIRALISWSVRGLFSGGLGGGTAERAYAEAAVRVSDGRSTATADVSKDLDFLIAVDREFETAFATRRVFRSRLTHYYLTALADNTAVSRISRAETVAVPIVPRVDREGEWTSVLHLDQGARELSPRVGNWVLLSRLDASTVPKEPFERVAYLMNHDMVQLTMGRVEIQVQAIADLIDIRQAAMAKRALSVWPREVW